MGLADPYRMRILEHQVLELDAKYLLPHDAYACLNPMER
jgi:hypothetical protein